jgi:MacB-like periplasmic core domain
LILNTTRALWRPLRLDFQGVVPSTIGHNIAFMRLDDSRSNRHAHADLGSGLSLRAAATAKKSWLRLHRHFDSGTGHRRHDGDFQRCKSPHASRIMMIWYAAADGTRIPQTFHTYRELAERNRSFDAIAVMKPWQPTFTGADQPERFDGQRVSDSYFRLLGVAPALGRDFQAADDILHGPKVVIVSNGVWRRRFGADNAIMGRDIKLDDDHYTVIGIMPAGFDNVLAPSAEFWSPLQYDKGNMVSQQTREWGHHLRMVGAAKDRRQYAPGAE